MKNQVYWLTGLSGSGKTTIGKALFSCLKAVSPAVVFLDGDKLREVFGNDLGYTETERRKCAMRYSRLCQMLSEQGLTVICCTISMFDSVRKWNRENIPGYIEVYIKASMETLVKRDQKGMYSKYAQGKQRNLIGLDLQVEFPKTPDITLENDGKTSISDAVAVILESH